MTSISAPPLPSGIDPPLAVVSSVDKSGLIAIISGFALGLVLLSAGIRLYARPYFRAYRSDDWAFFAAVIVAVIQTSLVFYEIKKGTGKESSLLSQDEGVAVRKATYASDLLYIIVMFLSKASCALMFLWLTPYKTHRKLVWGLLAMSVIWVVTSLFLEGFRCPGNLWGMDARECGGYLARWLYISVFDILIELALILTSPYLVWGRQMALYSKCIVVGAFVCRAPNILLTTLRLIFLSQPLTPTNSDTRTARLVSTTQLAIGYTITACVIPYLRPLMQAYEPGASRRTSADPSFKLSERSSKGSTSAGAGVGVGWQSPPQSPGGEGDVMGHRTHARASFPPAQDEVSRGLEWEKEGEGRGGEGWGGLLRVKKTVDWSVRYDDRGMGTGRHKPSVAVAPDQRLADEGRDSEMGVVPNKEDF